MNTEFMKLPFWFLYTRATHRMSEDKVKEGYNREAGKYIYEINNIYHKQALMRFKQYKEVLSRYNFNSLLDVGAGEFTTISYLAKKFGKNKRYAGLELANKKVELGKEYCKKNGVKVEAYTGTATKLPFKDNEFDIVMTSHCLEQMPFTYKKAIDEMLRVTNKVLILFEPSAKYGSFYQKYRMFCLNYALGISNYLKYDDIYGLDIKDSNRTFVHIFEKQMNIGA
jgi:ubiquinone/menaquinone biosynthesis C-methylase UbiE